MSEINDELLLAYVDGELDADQRARVEAMLHSDPEARKTVQLFQESAGLLRGAFDDALRAPVPEKLLAAVRSGGDHKTGEDATILAWTGRWKGHRLGAALAASIGIGVASFVGYILGGVTSSSDNSVAVESIGPMHDPALNGVLEMVTSGSTTQVVHDGLIRELSPRVTFVANDGRYCREYEERFEKGDEHLRGYGVACRGPEAIWRIELFNRAQPGGPTDAYAPAASGDPEPLSRFIGQLMKGNPLEPDEEDRILRSSWQRGKPQSKS